MKCKVCNITEERYLQDTGKTFYDKSSWRPLCSKACYSIIFDDLMRGKEHANAITKKITKKRRESEDYRKKHNDYMKAYKQSRRKVKTTS